MNESTVIALGFFDGVHIGHGELLKMAVRRAQERGCRSAAFTFDRSPREFVTDYPQEIKAFYMRLNDDGRTVAAADCLVPGIGEIIGGSQREERLDLLESRIRELGMKPEDYWWYCDLRRYGSCRHAGFGLGFERMVMYPTGISNIRDVELHPRTVGNADF